MGRFALVLASCLVVPSLASADVFKLFGEIHGGGMYGKGVSGAVADAGDAFFERSPHPTYGLEVGAELLFLDGWIEHDQYRSSSQLTTWTQFGLGAHHTFDTGDAQQRKDHKGGYFELGGGLWFGLGTGQQVQPPLDNAQISDKAFLLEGRAGFGTHLNSVFDLGLEVPVSYGFFFKTGNGAGANDMATQYRSFQLEGLLALRANIRLL
jgi:hypothetical protein